MRLAFATYRALPQLSDDDRLAVAALRVHGVSVESAVWDSPLVDWRKYDAVVLRSTWDYHQRPEEFESWLAYVEHLGVPTWNPPPLIRWNMDKRYLTDLASRGVATVPTLVLDRGDASTLDDIVAETGWKDLVFKPAISASGFQAARARTGRLADHRDSFVRLLSEGDVLVRPFVGEMLEGGEWSFLFFAGQFSHAVKRRPRAGEFRVQQEPAGSAVGEHPRSAMIVEAERVVAHLPGAWLYARVDACEVSSELLLVELQLVEPSLFLALDPSAPRRFAAAVRQLVAGRQAPIPFTPRPVTPP